MARRLACFHGHFYQPPRENPWLEAVEVEDSAAPYHDWNARITAECYAANAQSRLLGRDGRVTDVASNYEDISFDFGPTLLSWLEAADPATYAAIIDADRRSVEARGGHGNALAHVYNHVILPLASSRDRVTQIRWGIADFIHRFGRRPEGMWLPETAVDLETLGALVDHGIAFTVLAPHQASAVRPMGDETPWEERNGADPDPTQPYACRLPDGRSIVLFFYDGPISRGIAFEGLLGDGAALARRVVSAFVENRERDQLVHVATDGESYGHHHRFGDMALGFAARALPDEHDVELTNYGEFLASNPPTREVHLAERTSWSCAHGVGRWSEDCGCRFSPETSQGWRAPLRAALDWLAEEVDRLYEARASEVLRDPWEARDRYIDVLLDRWGPETVERFLDEHGAPGLDHFGRTAALSLLEMERHRMLMYTSCGWFFDDPGGLETVQILKYAARALQLATAAGGERLEPRFEEHLAKLESNDESKGDGTRIYRELAKPAIVDLRRVVAHHAITSLFEPHDDERRLYCYHLETLDRVEERYGATRLAVGRVRVRSLTTSETEDLSYGVLHFGGHDFNCSLRGTVSVEGYNAMRDLLLETFEQRSLTDVVHGLDRHFEGRYFALPDIFLEGRRRVLGTVTEGLLEELEDTYEQFYDNHLKLFDFLCDARFPLPDAFRRTIEFALQRRVLAVLERTGSSELEDDEDPVGELEGLVEETTRRGVRLSEGALCPAFTASLEGLGVEVVAAAWSPQSVMAVRRALAAATRLTIEPKLLGLQNALLTALRDQAPDVDLGDREDLRTLLAEIRIDPERLDD